MNSTDISVEIYDSHEKVERAVKTLQRRGFDMKKLSIIGKDYHTKEHVVGYFNAGDRVKFFGKLGAFWGGLAGMLFGVAFMFVPIVGHIVILGPFAATLVGGLSDEAVGGGLSALAGALIRIGIPKHSLLRYGTAIRANKFLLIVHGTSEELTRTKEILANTDATSIEQTPATV
jgi:uncharacterized membrane protein